MKPTSTRRRLLASAGAAGLLTGTGLPIRSARAQASDWPSKPLRVIVAFAPGGLTDAYARMFAEQFTAAYKQPAVVDNKPGAGGNIAIESLTKSPADGYTVLFATSGALWQNRVLYSKLPFDLAKDIAPIAFYPSGPLVFGVGPKTPGSTVAEVLEHARKKPSSMGSYAPASYPHMLAAQFNRQHGTQLQAIHYRGEAPMWIDVVSGQIEMAVGSFQAFNTVASKGVRAVGVTGGYRSPRLPDVPTLAEQGIRDELVTLEGGLPMVARTGTAEDILRKLAAVAVEGNDTPRAATLRENFAIPNKALGLEETRAIWRDAAPIWIRNAQALGVKLD
ncbi:MAG: Bug family tripartite tricarboxylate transporter substrate binding protein [Lautropia sp.]